LRPNTTGDHSEHTATRPYAEQSKPGLVGMKPTGTLHAAASPVARRGSIAPAAFTSDRTQAQSARRCAAAAAHVP